MTASDLYEIVRDVPREAWPVNLWYFPAITCGDKAVMNADGAWRERPNGQFVSDATAESAFIGSMLASLPLGFTAGKCEGYTCQNGLVDATHIVYNCNEEGSYVGSSLVAALASVCKEIGA